MATNCRTNEGTPLVNLRQSDREVLLVVEDPVVILDLLSVEEGMLLEVTFIDLGEAARRPVIAASRDTDAARFSAAAAVQTDFESMLLGFLRGIAMSIPITDSSAMKRRIR